MSENLRFKGPLEVSGPPEEISLSPQDLALNSSGVTAAPPALPGLHNLPGERTEHQEDFGASKLSVFLLHLEGKMGPSVRARLWMSFTHPDTDTGKSNTLRHLQLSP